LKEGKYVRGEPKPVKNQERFLRSLESHGDLDKKNNRGLKIYVNEFLPGKWGIGTPN